MLAVCTKAPDFTLNDMDGNTVSLSNFDGRVVVLYFYPKDDTPGCTRQACGFADHYPDFSEKAAVIIGISKDGENSHQKFSAKYKLPFLLLSDPDLNVIRQYDVWKEKTL